MNDQVVDTETLQSAAKAFAEATEPEVPSIEPPEPGDLTLMWGLPAEDESRQLRAEVRELNGADEEAMSRLNEQSPSYFTDLVDLVIRRATTMVGDMTISPANGAKTLGELLVADRDLLFKEIILATFGKERTYEGTVCPHCSGENDIHIDVPALIEVKVLDAEPFTTVTLRDGDEVVLHFPLGKDQRYVYDTPEELSQAGYNTRMLSRCIDSVNGSPIGENQATRYALDLGMADRRTLVTALTRGPSVKFKEVEVPCTECGEKIPFAFGWADLLWV